MFQDALANACAPISIKIDIDPSGMVPGPKMPPECGTSLVDRDHKYCPEPDPIAKMMQEIMCKTGMCPPEACDPGMKGKLNTAKDKPDMQKGKPDTLDDKDSNSQFDKNKFKK